MRTILDCYLAIGGCVLAWAAVDEACGWLSDVLDRWGEDD